MKCLIKSLLGQDSYDQDSFEQDNYDQNEVCTPLPPIVKSIVGSVAFIILMAMVSNLLRI